MQRTASRYKFAGTLVYPINGNSACCRLSPTGFCIITQLFSFDLPLHRSLYGNSSAVNGGYLSRSGFGMNVSSGGSFLFARGRNGDDGQAYQSALLTWLSEDFPAVVSSIWSQRDASHSCDLRSG
jgi:hypothetical protein